MSAVRPLKEEKKLVVDSEEGSVLVPDVTHPWSFDSSKFSNVEGTRELMELLYMVPPLYHLNRETWPLRRDRIVRHLRFWSPIHRKLAPAPMTGFEWLTPDRLLQRTAFRLPASPHSFWLAA